MNPFEISKPEFALHEIHEKREEILSKGGICSTEIYSTEDQELLYQLRIAELLWCLDEANEYVEACKGGRARGFAEGLEAAAKIAMASKYNEAHWRTISRHSIHCHRGLSISNEIRSLKPKKERDE